MMESLLVAIALAGCAFVLAQKMDRIAKAIENKCGETTKVSLEPTKVSLELDGRKIAESVAPKPLSSRETFGRKISESVAPKPGDRKRMRP